MTHEQSHEHGPHAHEHREDAGADGHDHEGAHEAKVETPPTEPVTGIMVDVGDGYGALVLYADADRVGLEPEIHPVGVPSARQHVWVLERAIPAKRRVFAAVFPSIPAGRYVICSRAGEPVQEVDVVDGVVTEAHWD